MDNQIFSQVIEKIIHVLEQDGTFSDGSPERRAKEIMEQFQTKDRVDFSPSRYAVLREEQGMTLLSVFEKGHNFYTDELVEEFPLNQQEG